MDPSENPSNRGDGSSCPQAVSFFPHLFVDQQTKRAGVFTVLPGREMEPGEGGKKSERRGQKHLERQLEDAFQPVSAWPKA